MPRLIYVGHRSAAFAMGRQVALAGFDLAQDSTIVAICKEGKKSARVAIESVRFHGMTPIEIRWVLLPIDSSSEGPLPSRQVLTMSDDDLKSELERLRAENAALKKGAATGISMKVSEKGGLSVYGMGRFPVTLYKEQWLKLLDLSDEIRAFIAANDAKLKAKG